MLTYFAVERNSIRFPPSRVETLFTVAIFRDAETRHTNGTTLAD